MHRLVLLRHGESQWNRENRFTGWRDVPLSEKGKSEAREAGKRMRQAGFEFDVAFTSLLQRAPLEAEGLDVGVLSVEAREQTSLDVAP